jgi:hypothetical protein
MKAMLSYEVFMRGKTLTYVLLVTIPAQALWFLDGLDLAEKLGLEAVVIAIAAVVVAIQHANELEAVAQELGSVARSVPTRGLGVFPNYLPEVAELVNRATESITILCDTPAHGAFSNTVAFEDYWNSATRRSTTSKSIAPSSTRPVGRSCTAHKFRRTQPIGRRGKNETKRTAKRSTGWHGRIRFLRHRRTTPRSPSLHGLPRQTAM